jgi:DNA-binding beta-propeller fold protein YncE
MLRTPNGFPLALAFINNDTQALVTDNNNLVILDLTTRAVKTVVTDLKSPVRIVIEGPGPTALVGERGEPRFSGDLAGRLTRVNFLTGAKSLIATGFFDPSGIAIEVEGQSALVRDGNAIYRVNLQTGVIATLATSFGSGGIALEAGGTSALFPVLGLTPQIRRINLLTNEVTLVVSLTAVPTLFDGGAIALTPSGSFAVIAANGGGPLALIIKVDLLSGETTLIFNSGIALFCSSHMLDMALTRDASEVIFSMYTPEDRVISRVRLADRALSNVTYAITPAGLALEGDGSTVLVTSIGFCFSSLYRIDIATGATDFISGAGTSGGDVVVSSGGQEALVTGTRFFVSTGDLFRINLATNQLTDIPITPGPERVVFEPGGTTALVTSGRVTDVLSRVTLATSQVSVVAQGLVSPAGIALSSSGQFTIVGSFANALMKVDLATGRVTTLTTSVTSPLYVAIEPGEQSVLVTENSIRLSRIDLSTGAIIQLLADSTISGKVVIEAGGQTALLATQTGIKRVRIR